jgi:hypothetical protein
MSPSGCTPVGSEVEGADVVTRASNMSLLQKMDISAVFRSGSRKRKAYCRYEIPSRVDMRMGGGKYGRVGKDIGSTGVSECAEGGLNQGADGGGQE